MKNKKYIGIVLIILISMISISAVSAASDSASDMISANNNKLILEENINEDVLTNDNNNNELILEESDISILASDNEKSKLKEGEIPTESFTQLNEAINGNTNKEINLSSNYKYTNGDESFQHGIKISRSVTINGNGITIDGSNAARIFNVSGENVILNNITFINGFANGQTNFDNEGGALNWAGRNGTLMYSTLKNNNASYGGAIEWDGIKGKVLYCTLENNHGLYGGGAIYWNNADGTIANCTFTNNGLNEETLLYGSETVIISEGIGGGAIIWGGEYGVVANCTLENNHAGEGGAIKWFGEEGILANNTLKNNTGRLGGAIHWYMAKGLIINNTIKNNTAKEGDGIRLYLTSPTITQNILMDGIFWFGETTGKINNNIIGPYELFYSNNPNEDDPNEDDPNEDNPNEDDPNEDDPNEDDPNEDNPNEDDPDDEEEQIHTYIGRFIHLVNAKDANINDNWWFGLNASNYTYQANYNAETWLYLNGTANPNSIGVLESSDIIFKVYQFNKTSGNISEYDNSLLPTVNFDLISTNGNITDSTFLEENNKYTATAGGIGSVTAKSEYAQCMVELTDNEIAYLTVDDQEFNYTEEPTIQLNYNNTATGTVNITLKGKVGHDYKFEDMNLNTTILLPEAILPDEYNLTVEYSGSNIFYPQTVNASLIVNKLKTDIEIAPFEITVKDTAGLMFEIILPENATGELSINMNGNLSIINLSEKGIKKDGKLIINLSNDKYPVGKYNLTSKYLGDEIYDISEAEAVSNIIKFQPEINAEASNITYGEEEVINLTIDATGDVKILLDGKNYSRTLEDGKASISIPGLSAGEKTARAYYPGDENNSENEKPISFTVHKSPSSLNATDLTTIYGKEDRLTITLKDKKDKGISDATISVELDGNTSNYTTENGQIIVPIKDLDANDYIINIKFAGDDNYNASNSSAKITVEAANSTVSGEDINVVFGESINMPISSENASNVNYKIINQKGVVVKEGTVEANGNISDLDLAAGEYTVNLTSKVDKNHKPSSNTSKITINKAQTSIRAKDVNVTYGEPAAIEIASENTTEMRYQIKDKTNDTVSNGTIQSNESIDLSNLTAGEYTAEIIYPGNENYTKSSASANVIINRITTQFNFTNMTTTGIEQKVDGRAGEYFYFQLRDQHGTPIAGKRVSIGSNGAVYNRTTNDTGWAKLQINLRCVNLYTFAVAFGGDDEYAGIFEVALINVTHQTPKLSTSNKAYKASAKTKTISATLKSAKGNPVPGKKIIFTINGKKYTAKTNSKGVATVKVSLNKKGTYKFTASFAGDNTYKKISKTGKLTIK